MCDIIEEVRGHILGSKIYATVLNLRKSLKSVRKVSYIIRTHSQVFFFPSPFLILLCSLIGPCPDKIL